MPTKIAVFTYTVIFSSVIQAEQITKLPELIVTSQHRDELLQQVPITINTFNHDFLTTIGAQSLADLDQFSPALEIDNDSTTQPYFKIRGIGTTDFGIGTDPAVSIYQDNIYIGRSGNALLQFTDIERVEVLKGPQGALFGRNSAAGVIHIITKKPTNELSASLRARYGNYDKRLVETVLNTPIIDNQLLLRINAIYNQRDGFVDNADGGKDFSDEDYQAARANLQWHITDHTQLNYNFEFNHIDQQGPTAIGLNTSLSPSSGNPFAPIANDAIEAREKRFLHAHHFNLQHEFSGASLNWISSYRHFDTSNREDDDGISKKFAYLDSENIENNQQFYQEFRLNGHTEHLDWVTGINYSNEQGEQELRLTTFTNSVNALVQGSFPNAPVPNTPLADNLIWTESIKNKLRSQSYAVFADITWLINEKFKLTLGVRHTRDRKEFSWLNIPNNILAPASDIFAPVPTFPLAFKGKWVSLKKRWHNTSPRIVLSYNWDQELMSFFSYAQGYKPGGFNSVQPLSNFDSESVENFEWGIKSSWFNQRLRANSSIFYYQYHDKQDVVFERQGNLGRFVTRTGNAEAKGAEIELQWLAFENLRLTLNYGYLDAKWTKRKVNAINFNTLVSSDFELAGHALVTPQHHGFAAFDYSYPIQKYGKLSFHLDHSYSSKRQYNQADADYYFNYPNRDASRHYTNLRLSWQDNSQKWQFAIWGENIFNNSYTSPVIPVTAIAMGTPYVRPDKPSLWGVEIIVNF